MRDRLKAWKKKGRFKNLTGKKGKKSTGMARPNRSGEPRGGGRKRSAHLRAAVQQKKEGTLMVILVKGGIVNTEPAGSANVLSEDFRLRKKG